MKQDWERDITKRYKKWNKINNTIATEGGTANETQLRIKALWLVFGKYNEILQNKDILKYEKTSF